jgi:hypothetical protein
MSKRIKLKNPSNVLTYTSSPEHSKRLLYLEQDTHKEDHILCSGCEDYFSKLEREFNNGVNQNVRDVNSLDEIVNTSIRTRKRKIFKTANTALCYLFIYSIIFRCHISKYGTFSTFHLTSKQIDELKGELNQYRRAKKKEILEIVSKRSVASILEFYLAISEHFDKSKSDLTTVLTVTREPSAYYLILGEYRLLFSFENGLKFDGVNNGTQSWLSIDFIDNTEWASMYDKNMHDISLVFQSHFNENNER